jgi:hypothetical protein
MNDRTLVKLTLAVLVLPIVIAAGCSDRYRYECHDPNNWETERCKRPICELHRDCPDMLLGLSDNNSVVVSEPEVTSIQRCEK